MVRVRKLRLVNPQQKKRRNRSRNPEAVTLGYLNPRHKRRHNPDGLARRPSQAATDMLKIGALALGGLIVTRQVPQMALGPRNTGVLGYVANAVTAVAAAAATKRFAGDQASQAVLIGGALYTVERILNEQFTPLGRALSLAGVGDPVAHGGLGAIKPAYYPWPVVYDRQGKPVIPQEITEAVKAELPPPPAQASNTASGSSLGRFESRF